MFNTVVLPQPECPIMHTNSPRSTGSQRSSKTGGALPNDRAMPSIEMMGGGILYSGNVTSRCTRPSTWSSSMPPRPITMIETITWVIDRVFHSFQTK